MSPLYLQSFFHLFIFLLIPHPIISSTILQIWLLGEIFDAARSMLHLSRGIWENIMICASLLQTLPWFTIFIHSRRFCFIMHVALVRVCQMSRLISSWKDCLTNGAILVVVLSLIGVRGLYWRRICHRLNRVGLSFDALFFKLVFLIVIVIWIFLFGRLVVDLLSNSTNRLLFFLWNANFRQTLLLLWIYQHTILPIQAVSRPLIGLKPFELVRNGLTCYAFVCNSIILLGQLVLLIIRLGLGIIGLLLSWIV